MKIADLIGRSPIPVPFLIAGKAALLACGGFFVVKVFGLDVMLFDSVWTQAVGAMLYLSGLAIVIVSVVQLGQSAAVGLPERSTELRVHGLYRFSRNPIYVGGFVMCAGSCLFSIHLVNILFFAIAVAVHLWIVAREEQFLEERFGRQWLGYKSDVPRYIGRVRRPGVHHKRGG